MDDHNNKSDDTFFDSWALLSSIERECVRNIDNEDDLVDRLHDQREAALGRLWSTFQVAASSLAQLYKERLSCDCCSHCINKPSNNHERWQPFQGAANKVTLLYRDGSEALRAGIELGYHAGYQRRTKDIANWTKKKRRTVRREEILMNLSGRSPPRRKVGDGRVTLSPKPMSPTNDVLSFTDTSQLDLNALMEGRNPFVNTNSDARKRHGDINMIETPHKRGRFS